MTNTTERTLPDGRWQLRTVLPDGKLISTASLWDSTDLVRDTFIQLREVFGAFKPGEYETMVFASEDTRRDLDVERYATQDEARSGHEAMVAKWLAALTPPASAQGGSGEAA